MITIKLLTILPHISGFQKFSVLGWSDGGISALILAGARPELLKKLVIWGSNSYVTKDDVELMNKVRDLSKWSARMREPLEGKMGDFLCNCNHD